MSLVYNAVWNRRKASIDSSANAVGGATTGARRVVLVSAACSAAHHVVVGRDGAVVDQLAYRGPIPSLEMPAGRQRKSS